MSKTYSAEGIEDLSRIDKKIFSCREFVTAWRGATAPQKLQFLDFLKGSAVCPKDFAPMVLGHIDVPVLDPCGWVSDTHLLGTSPNEYRQLRQDRTDCFQAVSCRAS